MVPQEIDDSCPMKIGQASFFLSIVRVSKEQKALWFRCAQIGLEDALRAQAGTKKVNKNE